MPDDPNNPNNNVTEMSKPATIDATADPASNFHFAIGPKPSMVEVVKFMAATAKMMNRQLSFITQQDWFSAANPGPAAIFNASANLEAGAVQLHQLIEQHKAMQQGGLVGPGGGGGVPQQAGRGPQRFPN